MRKLNRTVPGRNKAFGDMLKTGSLQIDVSGL